MHIRGSPDPSLAGPGGAGLSPHATGCRSWQVLGDYDELSLRGIRLVLVAASDTVLRVSPLLDGNKCVLSLLELGMAYVVSPVPQIE
jgi:hypothetical protein